MASCSKCGATLVTQARFCARCGSPVVSGSSFPAGGVPSKSSPPAADPYARTVFNEEVAPPPAEPARKPVSPMAASVMRTASEPPPAPSPAPAPAAPAQRASSPPGATQYAPPLPQATHVFAPGALVLVHWADGNRYPGTVLQIAPHHVFVAFPNGVQQWIDARYVQTGS
jgi:hypothetical protein